MSDLDEQQAVEVRGSLVRLAESVRTASMIEGPQRIRTRGTKRIRRHRAGRAVLGTAALAAVVLLGTQFAVGGAERGHAPAEAGTAFAGASTGAGRSPSPGVTTTEASHRLPFDMGNMGAMYMQMTLRRYGYTHLAIRSVTSPDVAAGMVIDVVDDRNHSVAGQLVLVDTPLTIVVSTGPAH
ncbi:hypothetical protein KDL01_33065 [Actinospica durhamensis]|uniref:Uncharacterized protein n=1 Tax=Actinospica durhamensis TaxID=1508375 RepID=A0A941EUW4_9ACTN|nr:hypothetical protein [Actinospica durhamensis]MBR7838150.1 hypothetical protein [Actinospica durhamensis]